jgi:hypothetical protein
MNHDKLINSIQESLCHLDTTHPSFLFLQSALVHAKAEKGRVKVNKNYKPQFDRNLNGSLYDRGSADKYYGRKASPHWYPNGTYKGEAVTKLTKKEIAEYMAGYNEQKETKY